MMSQNATTSDTHEIPHVVALNTIHYIDLLCAAADAMYRAGISPREMAEAMHFIATAYAAKEDTTDA